MVNYPINILTGPLVYSLLGLINNLDILVANNPAFGGFSSWLTTAS